MPARQDPSGRADTVLRMMISGYAASRQGMITDVELTGVSASATSRPRYHRYGITKVGIRLKSRDDASIFGVIRHVAAITSRTVKRGGREGEGRVVWKLEG